MTSLDQSGFMTERVPIKEAAARLGISPDTIRRRLKSGELVGERRATPQGFVWLVELPRDVQPTAPTETTNAAQAASVLVEDALEAVRLRERVDGLERLVGDLQGERDAWKAQAERHEEASRELRILVQQAQALARALPATTGATEPQEATEAHRQASSDPPMRGLWQRLWSRLGRA